MTWGMRMFRSYVEKRTTSNQTRDRVRSFNNFFYFLVLCGFLYRLSLFSYRDLALGAKSQLKGGRIHCWPDQPKTQIKVLGHSLVCSLVRSHRSLICLLLPAHFIRALRFLALTPLLAYSLCSLPRSWESEGIRLFVLCFSLIWIIVHLESQLDGGRIVKWLGMTITQHPIQTFIVDSLEKKVIWMGYIAKIMWSSCEKKIY